LFFILSCSGFFILNFHVAEKLKINIYFWFGKE